MVTWEGSSHICHADRVSPSMNPLMLSEGGAATEGLSTLTSLIGLLSGVDDGVLNEACAPPEDLPTHHAFVGLLSTVNLLVAGEV